MKRKNGFYWVKIRGEWVVAEFVTDNESDRTELNWSDTRIIGYHHESELDQINETRLLPPHPPIQSETKKR